MGDERAPGGPAWAGCHITGKLLTKNMGEEAG